MGKPTRLLVIAVGLIAAAGGVIMALDRSAPLREGEEAPDFTARLTTGEEITLRQFRMTKAVVLSFYPADFTAGCTQQACSYRDNYAEIERLGAVLLGVSTDGMGRHLEFAQAYSLPYPLISDPDGSIIRRYGAERFGGKFLGTRRVTYVIDKEGIIRLVAHHEMLIGRHVKEILETLRAIGGTP